MDPQSINTNLSLIMVTGAFLVMVMVLLAIIVWQTQNIRKQIAENRQPQTGFLGKPLMASLMVLLIVGGFGSVFSTNQANPIGNDYSVSDDITFEIKTFHNRLNDQETDVSISIIPKISGEEWGGDNPNKFDVFWAAKGERSFSYIELGLNSQKKGGFKQKLTNGYYTITAEVFYAGNSWTVEKELRL